MFYLGITVVGSCLDAHNRTEEDFISKSSKSRYLLNVLGSEARRIRCAHEDRPLHQEGCVVRSKSRRRRASAGLSAG
jgi:hypothetical protein